MKFSFVFGFILLILLIIGIFVGLPYAAEIIKSGSFKLPISLPFFPTFRSGPRPLQDVGAFPKISTSTPISGQTVKKVSIGNISRYGKNEISLRASYFSSQGEKVNITGWKIKSAQKGETIIGKGIHLPQFNVVSSDIWLKSGESMDISIGLSPLAINFRANNCFGWLNNLYNLDYSLNYCPGAFKLVDLTGLDSACQDLILRASSCRAPSDDLLNKSSYQCRQWVEKNMNYNTCVANHRNDSDFYKGWKIYTGNNNLFFDPLHDRIELRDQNGILIDVYEY